MSKEKRKKPIASRLAGLALVVSALVALGATAVHGAERPTWLRDASETAEARQLNASTRAELAGGAGFAIHLKGAETPELFMPWELFNSLVHRGFFGDSDARDGFRLRVLSYLGGWADREDLWPAVESAAAAWIEALRVQRELLATIAQDDEQARAQRLERIRVLQASDCADRRAAMDGLIDLWGEREFLQVLYQGVAPEVEIHLVPRFETSERLQFVEEGCKGTDGGIP